MCIIIMLYRNRYIILFFNVCIIFQLNFFCVQVSQCLRYGARVDQHGDNLAEAKQHAMNLAEANKLKYING